MKAISKRIRQLEQRSGLGPESEKARRLRHRIEEGRRRVAEARASGVLQGGLEIWKPAWVQERLLMTL